MRLVISVILLMGLLVSPALGMIIEKPIDEETISPSETVITVDTIAPEETVTADDTKFEIAAISYIKKSKVLQDIMVEIEKIIGLNDEPQETEVNVEQNGVIIAIIPLDSKFNGVEVHTYCLDYQYGTENWYACEQELA